MDCYRVFRNNEHDTWCVVCGSDTTPIGCFPDKEEAIELGRSLAQDSIFGRLTVEAPAGVIEFLWSYGSDPVG